MKDASACDHPRFYQTPGGAKMCAQCGAIVAPYAPPGGGADPKIETQERLAAALERIADALESKPWNVDVRKGTTEL